MIKDAKGRKWFLRFKQYPTGWHWEARHGNHGQSSGIPRPFRGRPGQPGFATKALAETNAQCTISESDAVKASQEFLRRLR
jgi:hypothetical protein